MDLPTRGTLWGILHLTRINALGGIIIIAHMIFRWSNLNSKGHLPATEHRTREPPPSFKAS